MQTFSAKQGDIEQQWYVVDAAGVPLGRLASRVAQVIRGKHKPTFTPHMDTGDGVIVVNAEKVRLSGRKLDQKGYFSHSGYMGHDKITPIRNMKPERVVEKAVFGMLPKNSLSKQVLRLKLRVYVGGEHPHAAQQPAPLAVFAPRPYPKKGK